MLADMTKLKTATTPYGNACCAGTWTPWYWCTYPSRASYVSASQKATRHTIFIFFARVDPSRRDLSIRHNFQKMSHFSLRTMFPAR